MLYNRKIYIKCEGEAMSGAARAPSSLGRIAIHLATWTRLRAPRVTRGAFIFLAISLEFHGKWQKFHAMHKFKLCPMRRNRGDFVSFIVSRRKNMLLPRESIRFGRFVSQLHASIRVK